MTENWMKDCVLKTGVTAYYDTFSGLIRCRVTSVRGNGVTFTLLEDRGAYKKGEALESSTLWVIPPGAVNRRQYSTTIGYYTVEQDE